MARWLLCTSLVICVADNLFFFFNIELHELIVFFFFEINPLSVTSFGGIFSHSVNCLLIVFNNLEVSLIKIIKLKEVLYLSPHLTN